MPASLPGLPSLTTQLGLGAPGWPPSRDWQLMLAVSKAPQARSRWSLTLQWARLGISMASWSPWPCSKRVTPEAAMPPGGLTLKPHYVTSITSCWSMQPIFEGMKRDDGRSSQSHCKGWASRGRRNYYSRHCRQPTTHTLQRSHRPNRADGLHMAMHKP